MIQLNMEMIATMGILNNLKRKKTKKRKIKTISTVFLDKNIVTKQMKSEITSSGRLLVDLEDFRYIKSLNGDDSKVEDSTYPHNFYGFIDKQLYDRVYVIFDPQWMLEGNGEPGFMNILDTIDHTDCHIFMSSKVNFCVFAAFDMVFNIDDIREVNPEEEVSASDVKIL